MSYLDELAHRIRGELPAGFDAPQDADDLFLLYAVLARAKGTATTARDVHDAWSVWATLHDPNHDAIRPFEELPKAVQAEDEPFAEAIRRCASGASPS